MRRYLTREHNHQYNRSGKRCCDICSAQTILVEHHICGRNIPNPNHPSNIANVCPNCHMGIHSGVVEIEKWVMSTQGKTLMWHKVHELNFTGEVSTTHQIGQKCEKCTTK